MDITCEGHKPASSCFMFSLVFFLVPGALLALP